MSDSRCALLATTAFSQKITQVPGGVVITSREPVYEIRAYARVYVALTNPAPSISSCGLILERAIVQIQSQRRVDPSLRELFLLRARML